MNNTVRRSPFARRATALCLVAAAAAGSGLTIPAVAAASQGFTPPGGKGDYLVHIGKRPLWASTLPRQRGTSVADLRDSTRAWTQGDRDYLVTVGKRTLWASQVRPPAFGVAAPTLRKTNSGRFVNVGKATFWVKDAQ